MRALLGNARHDRDDLARHDALKQSLLESHAAREDAYGAISEWEALRAALRREGFPVASTLEGRRDAQQYRD